MGRAKEEWMQQQELEAMHDWIEENYGYLKGSDDWDSDDWDEAIQAYEDRSEVLIDEHDQQQLAEDLGWYIYGQSQKGRFDTQMKSVLVLIDAHELTYSTEAKFSLLVMLHGHIVAAVESYLASTFIHKVTNSEFLIRKLIETDPVFSKRKFTLKEIYEEQENLKLTVATYLKDIIFHNIGKVKPMFKNVLECDFGDINWLAEAVNIRHDCVHRAGRNKDEEKVNISIDSIKTLVENSKALVNSIETKVDQIK